MKQFIRKFINKETIVYVIFGVLTTIINYVAYWLFRKIHIEFLIANVLAWIVALLFAFITNKLFVFESKSFAPKKVIPEFFGFVAARVLSFLFEEGFIALAHLFGMNEYLAKIISNVVVVIINYFASKFLIFRKKKEDTENVD